MNKKLIKSELGFGTAFKATLGFIAAQVFASVVGILIIGTVILTLAYLLG